MIEAKRVSSISFSSGTYPEVSQKREMWAVPLVFLFLVSSRQLITSKSRAVGFGAIISIAKRLAQGNTKIRDSTHAERRYAVDSTVSGAKVGIMKQPNRRRIETEAVRLSAMLVGSGTRRWYEFAKIKV